MVADIAGDCCAERGADAHCGADYSLRQIVMASAAHDIGENEGDEHAKDCGRYAIEQLDCDHESRLAACRKRSAAYSQCQEAQHKQRTLAPAFGSAAIGGRDGDHHELRRENAYRKDERCGLGKPRGEETRHDRQRGGIAKLEQEHLRSDANCVSACWLIAQGMKFATRRSRPFVKSAEVWKGPQFASRFQSFPSGHVAESVAFFGVLLFANLRIGLICLPIPLLIGYSRICVAEHYLSDLVVAAALGLICAIVVAFLLFGRLGNA